MIVRSPWLVALPLLALFACDEPAPSVSDAGPPPVDAGPGCRAELEDFPEPVTGACRSTSAPSAELAAGADDGVGGVVLPGGERVIPVGRNVRLGGFPMRLAPIPGTRFAVMSDGGLRQNVLAVLDVDTLDIVSRVDFPYDRDSALFLGLAVSADGRRLWVSGGGSDRILAYDIDIATGVITASPARTIEIVAMRGRAYVSGLALRGSGAELVALHMFEHALVRYDANTGAELGRIGLEDGSTPYDLVITPDGATAFVSLWAASQVVPVDLATGMPGTPLAMGKNPQGLALSPDGMTLAVACSDGDVVEIVDVATRTIAERVYTVGAEASRGAAPAALRFDAAGRLYVVDALENAIDVLERRAGRYERVGRVPTYWHPTDVLPLDDGAHPTLVFTNGRHLGTGANTTPGATDITDLLGGSVSVVDAGTYDDTQLAAWELALEEANTRMRDFVDVECDAGADYDFPIPLPGSGPSTRIRHVILIVRENKTYDAYLGNLTDAAGAPHGNGDPTLTLFPPEEMDQILPNTRALSLTFAMADNYYSHAEQSVQGHIWTVMGRTTDFTERSWLTTWGRGYWQIPPAGTTPMGYPEEGSVFDYLVENGISVHNMGEIVGSRSAPLDPRYPGLTYSYVPDIGKADYFAGRIAACGLRSFSYLVMPTDHTRGRDPGAQTPRSMIADNDEAIGRVIEAISHSTYWPETVVFVIEDDPQDGGDHVDNHRAPLLVASPWARRGHVSPVHSSEASIHRTIQLIFGLSEVPHSLEWEEAAPLYDMFTSTPDYAPYERIPRRWPQETNPDDRSFDAMLSAAYDWSRPDEQPGLSRMLWRHLRGTEAPWSAPVIPEEPEED